MVEPATGYQGIGHELRRIRQQHGLDHRDISTALRINGRFLEALEEGRFADLPGPAYISGFIRSYANYLGLDPRAVMDTYRAEAASLTKLGRLVVRGPVEELTQPRWWLAAASFVAALVLFLGWSYWQDGRALLERVAEPPENLKVLARPPGDTASRPAPTGAVPATPPLPEAAARPAASEASVRPIADAPVDRRPNETAPPPIAAPAGPPVASLPPSPSGAQVFGQGNRDSRIVLRAISDSWVQVVGANNEQLLTRILRTGDTYHAPNRPDLLMTTGNAGGIEVTLDGQLLGAVGPAGVTRREIPLDPEKFTAWYARRP